MTQFRSKQDGTHYPLKKGHVHKFTKPTYPGVWECRCGAEKTMDEFKQEERKHALQTDIDNCERALILFKKRKDQTMTEQTEKLLLGYKLKLAFIEMNECETIADVRDYLDNNFVLDHQFHHEMVGCRKTWELPAVTENNKNAGVFGTYFCTIYHDDLSGEDIFIGGKMGNTVTYVIQRVR